MYFNEHPDHKSFRAWLRYGPVGSRYLYHQGFLAADRETHSIGEGVLTIRTVEPLNSIAGTAMTLAEKGALHLLQHKIGPGMYQYIAQKRREIKI